MSHRAAVFLLEVFCLWTVVKGAERSVSCLLSEPCTLPCLFDPGPEAVIHWLQPPDDSSSSVHSFYHEKDQLTRQKPQYKDRTQLFHSEIARGNASLRITGVQVQDSGRYKCYTSTTRGNNEDFIMVDVEAPVSAVSLLEDGQELHCVSTNIYPKPSVSWSPPSSAARTTVTPSEGGVWSVHSSVSLPHSLPHQYSCNVSNSRGSWRSATYRRKDRVTTSGPEITVSCSDSQSPIKTLLWTFNKIQTILNQTGPAPVYSPDWESRVKLGPGSDLVLRNLKQNHQGLYSCVLTTDDQSYLTVTEVNVEDQQLGKPDHSLVIVAVVILVLVLVIVAVAGFFLYRRFKRKTPSPPAQNGAESIALKTSNGETGALTDADR